MDFKIRKLNSTDIFPMCSIISKIGVGQFKDCFSGYTTFNNLTDTLDGGEATAEDKEERITAIGMAVMFDVAGIVLGNLNKCQNEIYLFLSSITDISEEELKAMPPGDFAEIVIAFFKKEELKDFMKVVSKFVK